MATSKDQLLQGLEHQENLLTSYAVQDAVPFLRACLGLIRHRVERDHARPFGRAWWDQSTNRIEADSHRLVGLSTMEAAQSLADTAQGTAGNRLTRIFSRDKRLRNQSASVRRQVKDVMVNQIILLAAFALREGPESAVKTYLNAESDGQPNCDPATMFGHFNTAFFADQQQSETLQKTLCELIQAATGGEATEAEIEANRKARIKPYLGRSALWVVVNALILTGHILKWWPGYFHGQSIATSILLDLMLIALVPITLLATHKLITWWQRRDIDGNVKKVKKALIRLNLELDRIARAAQNSSDESEARNALVTVNAGPQVADAQVSGASEQRAQAKRSEERIQRAAAELVASQPQASAPLQDATQRLREYYGLDDAEFEQRDTSNAQGPSTDAFDMQSLSQVDDLLDEVHAPEQPPVFTDTSAALPEASLLSVAPSTVTLLDATEAGKCVSGAGSEAVEGDGDTVSTSYLPSATLADLPGFSLKPAPTSTSAAPLPQGSQAQAESSPRLASESNIRHSSGVDASKSAKPSMSGDGVRSSVQYPSVGLSTASAPTCLRGWIPAPAPEPTEPVELIDWLVNQITKVAESNQWQHVPTYPEVTAWRETLCFELQSTLRRGGQDVAAWTDLSSRDIALKAIRLSYQRERLILSSRLAKPKISNLSTNGAKDRLLNHLRHRRLALTILKQLSQSDIPVDILETQVIQCAEVFDRLVVDGQPLDAQDCPISKQLVLKLAKSPHITSKIHKQAGSLVKIEELYTLIELWTQNGSKAKAFPTLTVEARRSQMIPAAQSTSGKENIGRQRVSSRGMLSSIKSSLFGGRHSEREEGADAVSPSSSGIVPTGK